MHVHHDVEVVGAIEGITDITQGQSQAAGTRIIPSRLVQICAMPGNLGNPITIDTTREITALEVLAVKAPLLQKH